MRTRFTLEIKKKCIEWRDKGKNRHETILLMQKELNDSNFDITKKNWSDWKLNKGQIQRARTHRSKNASYRPVDDPISLSFEKEVAKKVEKWNATIAISHSSVRKACQMIKQQPQYQNEAKLNLMFSDCYCKDLMFRAGFTLSSHRSNQKRFTEDETAKLREDLQNELLQLQSKFKVPTRNILNCDESPMQQMNQNRVGFRKKNTHYKHHGAKERLTFLPTINATGSLHYPPAFICKSKCLSKKTWKLKSRRAITKKVIVGKKTFIVEQIKIEYKSGQRCVVYVSSSAWINSGIFHIELERLSNHLKCNYPNETFILMMDNCGGHENLPTFDNLVYLHFKSQTTGIVQPLDQLLFGLLKNEYRRWLETELINQLESGITTPKVSEGACCEQVLKIYSNFDEKIASASYKRTGKSMIIIKY